MKDLWLNSVGSYSPSLHFYIFQIYKNDCGNLIKMAVAPQGFHRFVKHYTERISKRLKAKKDTVTKKSKLHLTIMIGNNDSNFSPSTRVKISLFFRLTLNF